MNTDTTESQTIIGLEFIQDACTDFNSNKTNIKGIIKNSSFFF